MLKIANQLISRLFSNFYLKIEEHWEIVQLNHTVDFTKFFSIFREIETPYFEILLLCLLVIIAKGNHHSRCSCSGYNWKIHLGQRPVVGRNSYSSITEYNRRSWGTYLKNGFKMLISTVSLQFFDWKRWRLNFWC